MLSVARCSLNEPLRGTSLFYFILFYLFTIAGCVPGTGIHTTQKRKKLISRAFSHFPIFVVSEKRLKETLSRKLPNSESAWR
jgi:hypothetical protein